MDMGFIKFEKTVFPAAFFIAAMISVGVPAVAQTPYAYPNGGQSVEQQQRDRWECHNWAVQQSGFDPSQPRPAPQYSQPQPQPQQSNDGLIPGGMVGGAVGGAAVGALGGAIAGNAGKGAAIGAGTGAILGLLTQNSARNNPPPPPPPPQQPAYNYQGQNNYNGAYGSCMQGRNYTVNYQ